jgi:hypothetical protein
MPAAPELLNIQAPKPATKKNTMRATDITVKLWSPRSHVLHDLACLFGLSFSILRIRAFIQSSSELIS